MKNRHFKKMLSFLLCVMLIAAAALFTSGCKGSTTQTEASSISPPVSIESSSCSSSAPSDATGTDVTVLGEGKTTFAFQVTDREGNISNYEIHTDREVVGEALEEVKLIEGEEGPYGIYVKSVNGIIADYDTTGDYWAFYQDGQYAMDSADNTRIDPEVVYAMKVES